MSGRGSRSADARERERRRREAERVARDPEVRPTKTFPPAAMGWVGALVAVAFLLLLLLLGGGSFWGLLYGVLAVAGSAGLIVMARRAGRSDDPPQTTVDGRTDTNIAVLLVALQLAVGVAGLGKEIIVAGRSAPTQPGPTTIIEQNFCPQRSSLFKYPDERS